MAEEKPLAPVIDIFSRRTGRGDTDWQRLLRSTSQRAGLIDKAIDTLIKKWPDSAPEAIQSVRKDLSDNWVLVYFIESYSSGTSSFKKGELVLGSKADLDEGGGFFVWSMNLGRPVVAPRALIRLVV